MHDLISFIYSLCVINQKKETKFVFDLIYKEHSGECNIFDDVGLQTLIFFLKGNQTGNQAVKETEYNVLQKQPPT